MSTSIACLLYLFAYEFVVMYDLIWYWFAYRIGAAAIEMMLPHMLWRMECTALVDLGKSHLQSKGMVMS